MNSCALEKTDVPVASIFTKPKCPTTNVSSCFNMAPNLIPLGVEAIFTSCLKIYPTQRNPLQKIFWWSRNTVWFGSPVGSTASTETVFTPDVGDKNHRSGSIAKFKYLCADFISTGKLDATVAEKISAKTKVWLGGSDPLDYISMYYNAGDSALGVLPHWHYVSFGLSDLHGDGRVHVPASITLQQNLNNGDSPTRLQSGFGFELTFRLLRGQEENPPTWPAALMQAIARYVLQSGKVVAGQFISWHAPLDGTSKTIIKHILLVDDPQLSYVGGPFGDFKFIQMVGICDSELKAAQHWNGLGVLNLLRQRIDTGGAYLLCDLNRDGSVLEMNPHAQAVYEKGMREEGSTLNGVSARCKWCDLDSNGAPVSGSKPEQVKKLENVIVKLNFEAALMLPFMLTGRLAHGRHFSFKSLSGHGIVTFVSSGVSAAFATESLPLCCKNDWLQVYLSNDLMKRMTISFSVLEQCSKIDLTLPNNLPTTFSFDGLTFEIVPDEKLLSNCV